MPQGSFHRRVQRQGNRGRAIAPGKVVDVLLPVYIKEGPQRGGVVALESHLAIGSAPFRAFFSQGRFEAPWHIIVRASAQEMPEISRRVIDVVRRAEADIGVRRQGKGGVAGRDHAALVNGGNVAVNDKAAPRVDGGPDRRPDMHRQGRIAVPGRRLGLGRMQQAARVPVGAGEQWQVGHRGAGPQRPQLQPEPAQAPGCGKQGDANAERHGMAVRHRPRRPHQSRHDEFHPSDDQGMPPTRRANRRRSRDAEHAINQQRRAEEDGGDNVVVPWHVDGEEAQSEEPKRFEHRDRRVRKPDRRQRQQPRHAFNDKCHANDVG